LLGARALLALAGLFGAAGVGLWAWATHAGQPTAAIAAQMLLIHAAALIALMAARAAGLLPERASLFAAGFLALGVALFAGDLAARAVFGQRLFPMASPLGGVLMILSWLAIAAFAFIARNPR
jgi:uncharacterized membrane protein YgdD (TMEM256/DUF423 family)